MIVQKIVNSLTNVSFFPEKNESIPPPPPKKKKKKKLKHNLHERVENSVANRRNVCMEKGFQCTVFSNLSEFNTLNGGIAKQRKVLPFAKGT